MLASCIDLDGLGPAGRCCFDAKGWVVVMGSWFVWLYSVHMASGMEAFFWRLAGGLGLGVYGVQLVDGIARHGMA